MLKYLVSALLIISFSNIAISQLNFEDKTLEVLQDEYHGILPICVSDLNGDLKDDFLFVPDGKYFRVGFQQEDGRFHFEDYDIFPERVGSLWALVAVDINQDGMNEVIAGFGTKLYLLENHLDEKEFRLTLIEEDIFCQNISVADYDQDGNADVFVCNDIGYNKLFSAVSGGFDVTLKTELDQNADFTTGGNYGSAFSDVDHDGDLDLYVSKCKQGETDPTAPSRINVLYENINGNLVEVTDDRGLSINEQSWTGTFGDLDNDLDLDLVVTNHTGNSMILLNDGNGNFTDTIAQGFRTTNFPLQSIIKDLDNNGHLDIIVTGSRNGVFMNQGNMVFVEKDLDEFVDHILSCAVGDFNSDGAIDIFASYGQVFVLTSNKPDRIFYNEGNDNNFIGFDLRAYFGHINGFGSKVYVHSGGDVFLRELSMGNSYGIANSQRVHFGLGDRQRVDSVIVEWNGSGVRQVYENLRINEYHLLSEKCENIPIYAMPEAVVEICTGESVTLTAPTTADTYLWNNGSTDESIVVTTGGFYQVLMQDTLGRSCPFWSETVFIDENPEIFTKLVSDHNFQEYFCEGDEFQLCVVEDRYDVLWNNGLTERCIVVNESGLYSAEIMGKCGSVQSMEYKAEFVKAQDPSLVGQTYDLGNLVIEVTGDSVIWYSDSEGNNQISQNNNILLNDVFNDTTVYAKNVGMVNGPILDGGKLDHTGSGGQNRPNFPGVLFFHVDKPFKLLSVEVECFEEGTIADISIRDKYNEFLVFDEVTLSLGLNVIELNLQLEVGDNYQISFIGDPKCFRNTSGVVYPYEIGGNLGSIISGGFTDSEYFYFYNWKVQAYCLECESDIVPFDFIWEDITELDSKATFSVSPNPSTNKVVVSANTGTMLKSIELMDVTGAVLRSVDVNASAYHMNIGDLTEGVYFIRTFDSKGTSLGVRKIVKLK